MNQPVLIARQLNTGAVVAVVGDTVSAGGARFAWVPDAVVDVTGSIARLAVNAATPATAIGRLLNVGPKPLVDQVQGLRSPEVVLDEFGQIAEGAAESHRRARDRTAMEAEVLDGVIREQRALPASDRRYLPQAEIHQVGSGFELVEGGRSHDVTLQVEPLLATLQVEARTPARVAWNRAEIQCGSYAIRFAEPTRGLPTFWLRERPVYVGNDRQMWMDDISVEELLADRPGLIRQDDSRGRPGVVTADGFERVARAFEIHGVSCFVSRPPGPEGEPRLDIVIPDSTMHIDRTLNALDDLGGRWTGSEPGPSADRHSFTTQFGTVAFQAVDVTHWAQVTSRAKSSAATTTVLIPNPGDGGLSGRGAPPSPRGPAGDGTDGRDAKDRDITSGEVGTAPPAKASPAAGRQSLKPDQTAQPPGDQPGALQFQRRTLKRAPQDACGRSLASPHPGQTGGRFVAPAVPNDPTGSANEGRPEPAAPAVPTGTTAAPPKQPMALYGPGREAESTAETAPEAPGGTPAEKRGPEIAGTEPQAIAPVTPRRDSGPLPPAIGPAR